MGTSKMNKTALLSSVWTCIQTQNDKPSSNNPTSTAVVAYPDGRLHFFSLPTCTRILHNAPSLHNNSGRPISLSLFDSKDSNPSLVIGTDTGQVLLNTSLITTLSNGSAIVASTKDNQLIVAAGGSPPQLVIINPTTELSKCITSTISLATHHTSPPSCITLLDDAQHCIVASQIITLIHLSTGRTIRKLSGHPSPISCCRLFRNCTRLVTASKSQQYMLIWDTDLSSDEITSSASKSKRRKKLSTSPPIATLIAPEANINHMIVDESDQTQNVSIAALLASGTVAVWRNCDFEETSPQPTQPSFVIKPNESENDNKNLSTPAVHLITFIKQNQLLILYGNSLSPHSHIIDISDVNDEQQLSLPLWDDTAIVSGSGVKVLSTDIKSKEKLLKNLPDAEVSNAVAAPAISSAKRRNVPLVNKEKGDTMMDVDEGEEGQVGSGVDNKGKALDNNEVTLEEKLARIGVNTSRVKLTTKAMITPSLEATRIESRISVILQAARSRDWNLMESSLGALKDPLSIRNTVDHLPAGEAAGSIFDILVDRLSNYPKEAPKVVPWIREILIRHAGVILAQRRNDALSLLVSTIKERTQSQRALSLLEGRLELVVYQADRVRKARETRRTDNARPDARYDEEEASSSSSDDEDEDDESVDVEDDEESESEEEEDETRGNSDIAESSESEDSDEEMTEIQSLKRSGANGIANGEKSSMTNGLGNEEDSGSDFDDSEDE